MQLATLIVFFIAMALLTFGIGAKILGNSDWVKAWFRGTSGLLFVVLAMFFALLALSLNSYYSVHSEAEVASISLKRVGDQQYEARIEFPEAETQTYELSGDLWQIDAQVIKWKGWLSWFGVKISYKLDRIQGRYYTLEQERAAPRTVYGLAEKNVYDFDLWQFARDNAHWLKWVDARYGSATYLPMSDGARFSVRLTDKGLIARPDNEKAEMALDRSF